MTSTATAPVKHFFSERELQEQHRYAKKYFDLIQKELSYTDLANIENITKYAESFKYHSGLAKCGYVIVNQFV